jgi:hypothetical protein
MWPMARAAASATPTSQPIDGSGWMILETLFRGIDG